MNPTLNFLPAMNLSHSFARAATAALVICFFAACGTAPSVEHGVITTQGRGAVALANDGDPLLETGASARKVSADFAKGYAKADIDNAHREYFARVRSATGGNAAEAEGRPTLYDLTLPERTDSGGIVRAPRPVVLSVVE